MTIKEFLSRYKWLNKSIKAERERLDTYRRLAESVPNTMKRERGATALSDRVSHFVAKAADLAVLINKRIAEMEKLKAEITRIINQVTDPRLNEILKKRYIDLKAWADIADEMGYGREHIWRLHGDALVMAGNFARNSRTVNSAGCQIADNCAGRSNK